MIKIKEAFTPLQSKHPTAFTLIELIIVIVIIGILATMAIARFINLRADASRATCQRDVATLRTALSNWYHRSAIDGTCPSGTSADCNASGFPAPAQLQDDDSYFADNFITSADLPSTSHITGSTQDWSAYYTPNTGNLDINNACP